MVHVFSLGDEHTGPRIDVTSKSGTWAKWLSPFFVGPVRLYGSYMAENMENAWQFAKVYPQHTKHHEPTDDYLKWALTGWADKTAHRYPMGKNAVPLYHLWDSKKLDYITARKVIYCPIYAEAVMRTQAWHRLKAHYQDKKEIWLFDFDGYDHRKLGMTYKDVLHCRQRKMGHAFVLGMLLENRRVWEE